MKRYFFSIFFIFNFVYANSNISQDFIKSFVECYDFRPEARYTHEYHKLLLTKTAESFLQLEDRIKEDGMDVVGRIFVVGYEGEAISSYYTNYRKAKINDEASSLSKKGWSLRLHNRFGLMSGFLFKDFNELVKNQKKDIGLDFKHINPEDVEIFADGSEIFQQHAFGEAYDLILDYKKFVEQKYLQNDSQGILSLLKNFWHDLYLNEVKTNDGQLAATQDILFSKAYAQYLISSPLPILHYYTGPDITYPIETSLKQKDELTRNAQTFLPTFVEDLKSVDDENTVYVFDSFVDGVGKSTMLGNVKNWIKYGSDLDKYERVDNSSSQYCEIFKFAPKIFIADLPAQVSHFIYKPDGYVYVDAKTELLDDKLEEVQNFAARNKEKLLENYNDLCDQICDLINKKGFFETSLNDFERPERIFIRNLLLLRCDATNIWLPFKYENKDYIFNYFEPFQIRVLRSLGSVASYGLKNIEAEQMLFSCVSFPISYDSFLDDFSDKLKKEKIKKVVFVDFLSMYPRSSRENVRINYLVQQLAFLDPLFDIENSLYKNFVSGAQLYSDLLDTKRFEEMLNFFQLEVALRLSLFDLICTQNSKNLETLDLSSLNTSLVDKIQEFANDKNIVHFIEKITQEKLIDEKNNMRTLFSKSKDFVNVQQFSFDLICRFSERVRVLFSQEITNNRLNDLWGDLHGNILFSSEGYDGFVNRKINLANGSDVTAYYEFFDECKNPIYLAPFFRTLRASWYATFANLLNSKVDPNGNIAISKETFKVPPMLLKRGEGGQVYLVQKLLDSWEGGPASFDSQMFHLKKSFPFGEYCGDPYCLDFENNGTNFGIFAFDCNLAAQQKDYYVMPSVVSRIVMRYQEENGAGCIIPTSKLYERLNNSIEWQKEKMRMMGQTEKNGDYKKLSSQYDFDSYGRKVKRIFKGTRQQIQGARLLVRLLATLEMILKDADGDVAIRKGNKKDFIAALKLFEEVTLPKYFGILFTKNLFDDYSAVEPILSWECFGV